eukprot:TRINITY_DN6218_c0_g2_i1.p1 TRINITY_DN6218_c0_g2~~TRINITY_DN6218_c0_g2_i1.p1  ORF type:complete len:373 (+),score=98.82 TRINITY_DN6218_c0_g2_i1:95-1120(+)
MEAAADELTWREFVSAVRPGGLTERELISLSEQTVHALAVAQGFLEDEEGGLLSRVMRKWRALQAEDMQLLVDMHQSASPYPTRARGRSVSPWSGLPRTAGATPSPSLSPYAPSAMGSCRPHSRRSRTPASSALTDDEFKKELEDNFITEPASTVKPTFSAKKPLRERTHMAKGMTPDGMSRTPVRHGTGKACASRSVSPANSRSGLNDNLPPYVPGTSTTPAPKAGLNSSVRKLFTSPKTPTATTFDRVMTNVTGTRSTSDEGPARRGRSRMAHSCASAPAQPRPSRSPNANRLKSSVGGASVLLAQDAATASPFSSRVKRVGYGAHPATQTGVKALMLG